MSLSRPAATFPLLKLPFLSIKCVLHNVDQLVIIYFATISYRTRRIVKSSNYPLKEIDIYPNKTDGRRIGIVDLLEEPENQKKWYFIHNKYFDGAPLVLQRNALSLRTQRSSRGPLHYLLSYTDGDDLDALKMGLDFLIDVFGCKIRNVVLYNNLSEVLGLGISSAKELAINDHEHVNTTDLKQLLETIKFTDEYDFFVRIPEDFYCDPQIFKCRKVRFNRLADWINLDILCQFDVPQLTVESQRLTQEDIVSYVTQWFNSENRKLEYLLVYFRSTTTLQDLKIDYLSPMPFCEKRRSRWSLNKSLDKTDMSSGMDILRQDGLLATFLVKPRSILFYIWHQRFPDTF